MVDHDPAGGGKPIAVFESGRHPAVSRARRPASFCRTIRARRIDAMQWLFWQMGNLGPMAGQNNHFSNYAVEKIPYAMDRYRNEVNRLYGVLDKRLADRAFVAGEYSIADMASYPWIVPHERQGQNIADFPHLKRWLEAIAARPAVVRAYDKAKEVNPNARRHPHRGRARDPVRADRGLGRARGRKREVIRIQRNGMSDGVCACAANSDLSACGERSPALWRRRVEGLSSTEHVESPLTPTLSPQAARGSAPSARP